MPNEITSFFVEGEPRPQGSKTPVRRGNKIILIEGTGKAPQLHKAWRAAVASAARRAAAEDGVQEIDYAVRVELQFVIPRPKSKHKRIKAVTVKPDIDKLSRSVLDGMTSSQKEPGLLLKDDSVVVEIEASKYYPEKDSDTPTGVHVKVIDIRDRATFEPEQRLFND